MTEKRITILGGKRSGCGAAVLARTLGYSVFLSDAAEIKPDFRKILKDYDVDFEEKKHTDSHILKAELVIKSPGIPDNVPVVQTIRKNKIPVISEIEFAYRNTNASIIAIAGTNGKTTTTLLTHFILSNAGINAGIAGNVGKSFAFEVATAKYDCYVLEISSFQLDDSYTFSPDIAVLLNITADHLDRYNNSMKKYISSEFRITKNLSKNQYFVFSADDQRIATYMKNHKISGIHIPFSLSDKKDYSERAYVVQNKIIIETKNNKFEMEIEKLSLQGKHNLYNSMAAGISSRLFDVTDDMLRESLSNFKSAEHRLEYVATVHGIDFINDSVSTNVNSAWFALEFINKKIVWLAGGTDKGNNYKTLHNLVKNKVKTIVCIGVDNAKIKRAFENKVPVIIEATNMIDAVNFAYRCAQPGDVVLLSPACASFDRFENFEDRGEQFKQAVKNL